MLPVMELTIGLCSKQKLSVCLKNKHKMLPVISLCFKQKRGSLLKKINKSFWNILIRRLVSPCRSSLNDHLQRNIQNPIEHHLNVNRILNAPLIFLYKIMNSYSAMMVITIITIMAVAKPISFKETQKNSQFISEVEIPNACE